MIHSLDVVRAGSCWYPVMLAQERGAMSEAKAAQLLGMDLKSYQDHRENTIQAVIRLASELTFPLASILEAIAERPELFAPISSASSSSGIIRSKMRLLQCMLFILIEAGFGASNPSLLQCCLSRTKIV